MNIYDISQINKIKDQLRELIKSLDRNSLLILQEIIKEQLNKK